ncbi:transposase [Streptomyces virginiae]|uniref:transposase n=1 Tax=Streptomyces virginiae TaxID=1961 RepID=UPI003330D7D1
MRLGSLRRCEARWRNQREGALYLRGLVLNGLRKPLQPMAERLRVDHQQLPQFVTASASLVEAVRAWLIWRAAVSASVSMPPPTPPRARCPGGCSCPPPETGPKPRPAGMPAGFPSRVTPSQVAACLGDALQTRRPGVAAHRSGRRHRIWRRCRASRPGPALCPVTAPAHSPHAGAFWPQAEAAAAP